MAQPTWLFNLIQRLSSHLSPSEIGMQYTFLFSRQSGSLTGCSRRRWRSLSCRHGIVIQATTILQ